LLRAVVNVSVRGTPARIEAFFDSHAAEQTRQRMRTDPWRPVMQQLITGLATFRRGLREPRPVRCNVAPLADSGIPVLVIIGRDEMLHDGARMAERFRQRLPGAKVILVNDAGHFIFIDQQDLVADELRAFLGQ
jgi:pimeloyl-ACP methyl ester carboxylesterase